MNKSEKIQLEKNAVAAIEKNIGYSFNDKSLLKLALTHSSYTNDNHEDKHSHNERIEFLGDAVLELSSSDYLYKNYQNKSEGELTRLRASIVCEPTLAICAKDIELNKYILLGKGEEITGGRERDSIVSDAFEAVIGAIYLDGGFAIAKDFVERFVLNDIEHKQLFFDSKTILQEIVQKEFKSKVSYELVGESGPDHNKKFSVNVSLNDKVIGKGTDRTKRKAEQRAAYEAILFLKQNSEK